MSAAGIDAANVNNLTALWKAMGVASTRSEPLESFHVSESWPHRCWFDWDAGPGTVAKLAGVIGHLPDNGIVPVWGAQEETAAVLEPLLLAHGFSPLFEQTVMYLEPGPHAQVDTGGLEIAEVRSGPALGAWTETCSAAFGYTIDPAVVDRIAGDPEATLLLGSLDGAPAATALIYRTGDVAGVHQVGVPETFRGRGLARAIMEHTLARCRGLHARWITLQASEAGKRLYEHLGFESQFMIRNYRRPQ